MTADGNSLWESGVFDEKTDAFVAQLVDMLDGRLQVVQGVTIRFRLCGIRARTITSERGREAAEIVTFLELEPIGASSSALEDMLRSVRLTHTFEPRARIKRQLSAFDADVQRDLLPFVAESSDDIAEIRQSLHAARQKARKVGMVAAVSVGSLTSIVAVVVSWAQLASFPASSLVITASLALSLGVFAFEVFARRIGSVLESRYFANLASERHVRKDRRVSTTVSASDSFAGQDLGDRVTQESIPQPGEAQIDLLGEVEPISGPIHVDQTPTEEWLAQVQAVWSAASNPLGRTTVQEIDRSLANEDEDFRYLREATSPTNGDP